MKQLKDYEYYRTELGVLYKGDCLTILPLIKDKVDLVLTDPPFNCGKEFANDKKNKQDFLKWIENVYKKIYINIKENGSILTECSKKYILDIGNILLKFFNYEHILINHYTNDMRRGRMGWSKYSFMLWFAKGKGKKNYCSGDLFKTTIKTDKHLFRHPSPKVISFYEKLIDLFSKENDLILDCFLGSGTTAIACEKLNRRWIGIEISEKYCETAKQRIKNEYDKLKLIK